MKNLLFVLCIFVGLSALAQPRQDSLTLLRENAEGLNRYLSNPDSVIPAANKTLNAAREKKFTYIEGESYFILSKAHWAKANYLLSTEYGFKALSIFENSKYTMYWGETILTLARNFIDLKEEQQAKSMIHSAMHLAKRSNHEKLLADTYREYTILLNNVQLYDSALRVADEALRYYEKVGDLSNACILYGRKAEVYRIQEDFENSLRFNRKSIQTALQSNNKRSLSIEYYHAAQHYFRMNKPDSTKKLLEASLALAEHIGNLPVQIRCHDLMAALYERHRETSDALAQYKIISSLKDSLQLREKSRQVAETFALQELENKEADILRLEKENESEKQLVKTQQLVSWFLVVIIILLLLLVVVLWKLRKNQFKAHKLLQEKNTAIEQQRKEIHEQAENLQRLNQVKTKLFSLISHDLRGPISNIQALLSMMTQRIMTVEEFIAVSEPLKAGLNLNQRTLENLLNWSLSQMEGIRTDTTVFTVNSVIQEVSELMHGIATQKEITIQNLEGCNCSVLADYNHVHLILRNIIHNAIKFSPKRKSISISTAPVKDFCKVVVRDHGVGLSISEIETLLNPNDYYSKAGTHYEKGTGLGLLLCKEFIKRNGGAFHIESDPVKGTEVSFTLPLAAIL